ncbi:hypothetical protein [Rhodopirellula sallentina]|uniref:hypothetical protein n=1 Tax=Rhodopirellula sallentina TaxID=1263869 RepID=UPI00034AEDC3|nr:hypothetical protein [Rhodopirellula sallentina]
MESEARTTGIGKSEWVEDGLAREILPDQDTLLGRNRNSGGPEELSETSANRLGQPDAAVPRATVTTPAFDSMVVIENLMLDRIARAIDEDPEDDYWVITATVTEFQDENRLMLLTAKRARRLRRSTQ